MMFVGKSDGPEELFDRIFALHFDITHVWVGTIISMKLNQWLAVSIRTVTPSSISGCS